MQIVHYPHPVLRFKSGDITRIDDQFQQVIREMFDLMYESKGVGLAANQVGLPLRFFVINPSGDRDIPEEELVFINPVIRNRKGSELGEEGCLSLPGVYGDVRRADEIVVEAFDLTGQGFRATLNDFAARVVQHEYDHIEGTLFIDRITDQQRRELEPKIVPFVDEYNAHLAAGTGEPEAEILQRLKSIAATGAVPAS